MVISSGLEQLNSINAIFDVINFTLAFKIFE